MIKKIIDIGNKLCKEAGMKKIKRDKIGFIIRNIVHSDININRIFIIFLPRI